jgi:hypothetical protein
LPPQLPIPSAAFGVAQFAFITFAGSELRFACDGGSAEFL